MTARTIIPLVLACSAAALAAQPEPEPTDDPRTRVAALIEQLEADDHADRVRATALLGDPGIGADIETLARATIDASPERVLRLHSSMLDLFSRAPKAGLGVGFGPDRSEGVSIQTVVDNTDDFPAAALLQPNDLILRADGRVMDDSDDLRVAILSHTPGETLVLLVRRDDQVLTIDAPLGSYARLRGAAPISPAIAWRAIEWRLDRLGIEPGRPARVVGVPSIDAWLDAAYPQAPVGIARDRASGFPSIGIGGDGRDTYAGLGASRRTLVTPWITREEASQALRESERVTLARRMRTLETRIAALTERARALRGDNNHDAGGGGNDAIAALRAEIDLLQRELRGANERFEALAADNDAP